MPANTDLNLGEKSEQSPFGCCIQGRTVLASFECLEILHARSRSCPVDLVQERPKPTRCSTQRAATRPASHFRRAAPSGGT